MTIETKYNIGDEVWVMYQNHPFKSTIKGVYVEYANDSQSDYLYKSYNIAEIYGMIYFEENIFPTKEELIKSL